jgi:hypothetical protein
MSQLRLTCSNYEERTQHQQHGTCCIFKELYALTHENESGHKADNLNFKEMIERETSLEHWQVVKSAIKALLEAKP